MRYSELTERQLVASYTDGNHKAFEELLNRVQSKVFGKIQMVVRDYELAQDLFQDTICKAIQALKDGQYNEEGKFGAWMMRIAHNLCIDHFRNAKKMQFVRGNDDYNPLDYVSDKAKNVEQLVAKREVSKEVRQLIALLPAEQKEIVMMRIVYDMSFKEIADQLNISINTALGRMRYALINLRKYMEKYQVKLVL
ncbi:MAG: sigma-70 family RNA polymerase sigma factor [Bacteroidetes bacterium]|jgi:RNA polymerase sigma-70 factor (ECF subfamily)|nr:sigma-70 family RNA polymerase sigma factor [Bacteroidota bacterium]